MRFTKMASQREERDIKARLVTASLTGSAASTTSGIPEGYTKLSALTSATGVITVNYLKPFVREPVVTVTCFHATLKLYASITAKSTSACTIKIYDEGGIAQNPTELMLNVTGFDCADQA